MAQPFVVTSRAQRKPLGQFIQGDGAAQANTRILHKLHGENWIDAIQLIRGKSKRVRRKTGGRWG